MPEEPNYPNLTGKRVSTTFRGLLHLPHSLNGTPEVVYDGQGTATSLTVSPTSLDVNGDTKLFGTLKTTGSASLSSTLNVLGSTTLSSTLNVIGNTSLSSRLVVGGNVGIGTATPTEKLQVEGTVRSYKNNIISLTTDDHELNYGDPNLFSIIVKQTPPHNFYIKHKYSDPDNYAPLWIDKITGEVNIKHLNVVKITTVDDPEEPPIYPPRPPRNTNTVPTGVICMFPFLAIPDGWFLCNGGEISKTTFPELFAVLGYTYGGSGDKFKVPDYRELFIRGWGGNRGIDPKINRLPGDRQEDELRSHTHSYTRYAGIAPQTGDDTYCWTGTSEGTTGATGGAETRPKNIAVAYAIKW